MPPGRTLEAEMKARNLSANALALKLRVPANRISDIVRNKRAITAETALRLGRAFGTSGSFWLNLQSNYDLRVAAHDHGDVIDKEVEILQES
ncbi:MAG TPA: HigA family addiction module antitoxin [Acetobacteraceae bacterium]|nr:HigA family addiction module antitoxin [Acetobacteraceae bacterium]